MGWIGVDLDGTLAHYESGQWPEIGEPIPKMYDRVKRWLDQGKEVRICTARAAHGGEEVQRVRAWLDKHGLGELAVTNEKDPDMDQLWDDKAVQVEPNTGDPIVNEEYQVGLAESVSIKDREEKERRAGLSSGKTDPNTFELMASLEKEGKKD